MSQEIILAKKVIEIMFCIESHGKEPNFEVVMLMVVSLRFKLLTIFFELQTSFQLYLNTNYIKWLYTVLKK